jgi:hypothetical protein
VFKGGETYDDYRKVNETAEAMGAMLNAYTSHDLVAFPHHVPAEVVGEAIDLLTDFVGRPRSTRGARPRARRRDQEIARANDQPVRARRAPHRPRRVRRPPARPPVLGPEEHLRSFSREAIVAFRERQWAGARGGAFVVGNLESLPAGQRAGRVVLPVPHDLGVRRLRAARRSSPQTLVEEPPNLQHSRTLRMSYQAPTIDPATPPPGRALADLTRRCSAARWARGCSTRSASSAASAYSSTRSTHSLRPTCPILQLSGGPGLDASARGYTRMREIVDELRTDGRREDEFERARPTPPARRVLAFENTNAVRSPRAAQTVVFGQDIQPDAAIKAVDETSSTPSRRSPRGISEELSIACVGPHSTDEFV